MLTNQMSHFPYLIQCSVQLENSQVKTIVKATRIHTRSDINNLNTQVRALFKQY